MEATELSFVKDYKEPLPNGQLRSFWNPPPPAGDVFQVERQGNLIALEALAYMAKEEFSPLLGLIALDMPRRPDITGIEVGFFCCVARFALATHGTYGDRWYRDHMVRRFDAMHQMAEREKRERSERARKAAKARWAVSSSVSWY